MQLFQIKKREKNLHKKGKKPKINGMNEGRHKHTQKSIRIKIRGQNTI